MQTDKLLDRLQDILREVGSSLLSMRALGPIQSAWQESQLKSEADLTAEALITHELRALTPSLPIVSEEDLSSHVVDQLERYWLVDPIDGTASFCCGYDGFVTQIALMEGLQPILGAVYSPALDRMYLAEHGAGASVNGSMIKLHSQRNDIALIDNYPSPRGIARLLYEHLPCAAYVESGSIGLKICRVADGLADLFVKDVTVRDWDLAPGHLILTEAGGVLLDLFGRTISYGGGMEKRDGLIAAASANLAGHVLSFLSDR